MIRAPSMERVAGLLEHRLARYGVAGGLSLMTHLLVLLVLVELFGRAPVLSSIAGFICSVVVSYVLQHTWVFRYTEAASAAFPRFLIVTLVGLGLNAIVMGSAIHLLGLHYLVAQAIAFAMVPVSNYLLNRSWTFAPGRVERRIPTFEFIFLLLATAVWAGFALSGSVHLDLARDMLIAADLLDGVSFPVIGPELAGIFHLGPVWYYLLALLQLIGEYGTVAFVLALMAGAQFWLAWSVADHLGDRAAALFWVGLLLIPSWSTFELLLMSHPVLTGALVTAVLLFGIRFLHSARATALAAMSLCFALGLHAHPTVLLLWPLPVGLALLAWMEHGFRLRSLLLALFAGALPFAPWLFDQARSGWPLLEQLTAYGEHMQSAGQPATALPLLWQMTGGGLAYWLSSILEWPAAVALAAGVVFSGVLALGVAGAVRVAWRGERVLLVMLIALIAGVIGLAMVRTFHAYYMLSGVRALLLGVSAFGLSHWMMSVGKMQTAPRWFAGGTLLFGLLAMLTFHQLQGRGAWSFSFVPLMSVTAPMQEHRDHPFLTTWAASHSGRWLCANQDVTIHGAYALSVIHSYASEARLHCDEASVAVHGGDTDSGYHMAGLSRSLLEQAKIEPEVIIGAFGLVPVNHVDPGQVRLYTSEMRMHPPLTPGFGDMKSRRVEWASGHHGLLVITDLSFGLAIPPQVRAMCEGSRQPPLARDNVTWIFDPSSCDGALEFELESPVPGYINVVGIARLASREDAGSGEPESGSGAES